MSALDDLRALLQSHRFRYTSEIELQDGIERLLVGNAFEYEREVSLGPTDRIDFLVAPGIGLECKVARRANVGDVERQVHRYLQSPRVHSLILVTDRSQIGLRVNLSPLYLKKLAHVVMLKSGLS